MKSLNIRRVMSILSRALDYIDVRLVDHGQRVAYILYKMLKKQGEIGEQDLREICIITALHDIGAYKTEEIDNMVVFESEDVLDHSIYGYLFLKNMSPLGKWAEVVLYHHLDYKKYSGIECSHLEIADMIHLADRMDILLHRKIGWGEIDLFLNRQGQDEKFSKEAIELFKEANREYDLEGRIKDGSYLKELMDFVSDADYGEETLIGFIRMIAFVIDFRSETTVSHVITTVSISVEMGRLLGLEKDELKRILLGAYLHDIGKISTPLEILEKPGKLTEEEMALMRNHILVTEKILAGRIGNEIFQIAFRHHEKVDGSGYPYRVKGGDLTLSERIVAVADVMSALTGKRSYKDSFDKDMVIDILRKQMELGKLCNVVIETAICNYDMIMENSYQNSKVTLEMYHNIRREFEQIKRRIGELD